MGIKSQNGLPIPIEGKTWEVNAERNSDGVLWLVHAEKQLHLILKSMRKCSPRKPYKPFSSSCSGSSV